jgi:tubulin polyglutamylase TTLL6/13
VLLKTEYSVIHNLIHKYFNYKFYNKEDQSHDLFLIWIDSYVSEEFVKRLKSYQRINHFPSSCELGRKDLLATNLNLARSTMPQLYQFYPNTWVLPRDFEAFSRQESSSFYIVKPHANCQGRGIYLTNTPNLTSKDEVIVQEYVENPMLIDGCKFDLRVYVMVRSLDPLRIYVYEEGLCRLATSKYSKPNENNFRNDKMHLTNYAINKFAPNFIGNSDIKEDNKGHKRSLTSAMKALSEMGFNSPKILERIDSMIVRSIMAAYAKMLQSYKKSRESSVSFKYLREFMNFKEEHKCFSSDNSNEQSVCFEVFGFDIMLLDSG